MDKPKSPLISKTLAVNMMAIFALWVQRETGFAMSVEDQAMILGVLNIVVRFFTHAPLQMPWKKAKKTG
jgi:hypothetical protein